MSKVRLLVLVVSILTVLNVVLLAIVFSSVIAGNRNPDVQRAREDRQIREIFHFDDQQMQAFLASKKRHGEAIREVQNLLQQSSERYYLMADTDAAKKSILLDSINDLTRQIYLLNDRHFNEIRQICRPEQLPHVDGLIIDLLRRPPESRNRGKNSPARTKDMN
ncbi:MAG: hypothetical protein KDC28_09285 [Saprospiraceae bacterium]|nr:hypothetical protein [Saprospiraceae bacterium]MCB9319792.1 hypothetical protein [Lewinellaceae bacterium]